MRSKFLYSTVFIFFYHLSIAQVTSLSEPFAGNGSVAIDRDGTIYVNEYGVATSDISGSGTRIFKVSPEGDVNIWKDNVKGAVGNTIDSQGNYYFNNGNSYKNSTLHRISKGGEVTKIAEVEGFSGDLLLSKDEKSLFIPSYTHPRIVKVSMDGKIEVFMEDERLKGSTGLVYGPDDLLLVSNFTSGAIYSISQEKEITEIAKIQAVYPGYVIGYITYFEEYIYATGYGSNKIYRISLEGNVEELAGSGKYESIDGSYLESGFVTPNGIEVDPINRRLIITQNGNGKPKSLKAIQLN